MTDAPAVAWRPPAAVAIPRGMSVDLRRIPTSAIARQLVRVARRGRAQSLNLMRITMPKKPIQTPGIGTPKPRPPMVPAIGGGRPSPQIDGTKNAALPKPSKRSALDGVTWREGRR